MKLLFLCLCKSEIRDHLHVIFSACIISPNRSLALWWQQLLPLSSSLRMIKWLFWNGKRHFMSGKESLLRAQSASLDMAKCLFREQQTLCAWQDDDLRLTERRFWNWTFGSVNQQVQNYEILWKEKHIINMRAYKTQIACSPLSHTLFDGVLLCPYFYVLISPPQI